MTPNTSDNTIPIICVTTIRSIILQAPPWVPLGNGPVATPFVAWRSSKTQGGREPVARREASVVNVLYMWFCWICYVCWLQSEVWPSTLVTLLWLPAMRCRESSVIHLTRYTTAKDICEIIQVKWCAYRRSCMGDLAPAVRLWLLCWHKLCGRHRHEEKYCWLYIQNMWWTGIMAESDATLCGTIQCRVWVRGGECCGARSHVAESTVTTARIHDFPFYKLYVDQSGCHQRSKHIDTRRYFLREAVTNGRWSQSMSLLETSWLMGWLRRYNLLYNRNVWKNICHRIRFHKWWSDQHGLFILCILLNVLTDTMIIVYIIVCVQTFIYPGCYIYVHHTCDRELKFSAFYD